MSSKITDAGRDLQVTESDMREIRLAEERSRLMAVIAGVFVVIGSAVAGYMAGAYYYPQRSYPYSAAAAGSLMVARSGGRKLLLVMVLGILSFLFGATVGNPSLGVVTYYGPYSQKT